MISDLAADLEERKKRIREHRVVRDMTEEEIQCMKEIDALIDDPSVTLKYCNQFVVPHEGKIIAHGTDQKAVLQEAAEKTGKKIGAIPILFVDDPLQEM